MNCPDCKGQVKLEEHSQSKAYVSMLGEAELEEIYYKCPKCRQEFDLESLGGE